MVPLPIPLNDTEGRFSLFETFLTPILRETQHEFINLARRAVPLQ